GRLSVGAPYFNRATLPFGLLMLVVIVLATFSSGKPWSFPALVVHSGGRLSTGWCGCFAVALQETP
ncbi:heme lyase NrfEFG subunit NrfE, partial [Escherichia coli]|nr:heme lyase NrfEFG subunit NrfE [Escherichia coli]